MAKNASFDRARKTKQDEFYTQLSDIEREMRYFKQHFNGKTVLCNCDDPYESNFFKYFALNFNRLGLKKLIATCYAIANRQLSLFDVSGEQGDAYMAVVTQVRDTNGDGGVDMCDVADLFRSKENVLKKLKGDGDFRSPECLKLLDEADIVVTNPPFSLFREYIAMLIEHQKKFIIIGSTNAISMKEIFPLMQNNKMWLGAPFQSGNAYFYIPEGVDTSQYAKGVYDPETRKVKFRNCCWYTNLDFKLRHEWLILVKRYQPEIYPSYDNLEDGININKVVEIPCDYSGLMGVPITFMSQYNPDQFEILGLSREMDLPGKTGMKSKFIEDYFAQGGTAQISEGHPDLCYYDSNGKCVVPYRRVIIRNKHPETPREAKKL